MLNERNREEKPDCKDTLPAISDALLCNITILKYLDLPILSNVCVQNVHFSFDKAFKMSSY